MEKNFQKQIKKIKKENLEKKKKKTMNLLMMEKIYFDPFQ